MLWSTAREPGWEGLAPVNDPVYAEGRLYALAVNRKDEYSPIFLVCLDADSGALLWKRELETRTARRLGPPPRRAGRVQSEIDVTHYGKLSPWCVAPSIARPTLASSPAVRMRAMALSSGCGDPAIRATPPS